MRCHSQNPSYEYYLKFIEKMLFDEFRLIELTADDD